MNRCPKLAGVSILMLLLAAYSVSGQEPSGQPATPNVKRVPTANVNPASGKDMYVSYCASCHGPTGTGNGPAASALKTPPANLTQLSANNGGKFPYAKVQQAIKGDSNRPAAHGSDKMPVWGPVLWQVSQHNDAQAQLRIKNIADYIATLQAK
jgi:mono/diheme cytochrome c family protein